MLQNIRHVARFLFGAILLCACLLLASSPSPAYATTSPSEHNHQTIRVAWFPQGDYQQIASDGSHYGYVYDYLESLAQYTNWEYEFIDTDGFSDAYGLVQSGEADIMGCVFYNDERAQQVDFPSMDMGITTTTLYVAEHSSLANQDYGTFDGIRVAADSSENAMRLARFAEEKGFSPNIITYPSLAQARQAVLDGAVDAGVESGYRDDTQTRSIARFDPSPFYLVTSKAIPSLITALNEGLIALKTDNPLIDEQLLAKYSRTYGDAVALTQEEQAFIASNPTIKVAMNKSWSPLESHNDKTDGFSGIIPGIFDKISEQTGLRFEYVQVSTNEEAEALLRDGEVQINAAVEHYYPAAQQQHAIFSHVYLSLPLVLANSPLHTGKAKTLAVPSIVYSARELYGNDYELLYFATPEDCFNALFDGTADKAAINSYSAEYLKTESRYSSIQLSTFQGANLNLCAAVGKDCNPVIISLVNKGIDSISDAAMNDLVVSETMGGQQITFQSFFSRIPIWFAVTLFVVLAAIVIALSLLVRSVVRKNKRIRRLLYHDSLTQLASYQGFLEQASNFLDGHPHPHCALVSIDVDYFEKYNALDGFASGNLFLKNIGQILEEECGEDEFAGRVFTDAFLLFIQSSDPFKIRQRIAALDEKLKTIDQPHLFSFSFGVYIVKDASLPLPLMCDHATTAKSTVKGLFKENLAFFDAEEDERQVRNAQMIRDMQQSLDQGEFQAYYQPKFAPDTQRIVGSEALVRWVKSDGTTIPPSEFVPLFEANGMICKIDHHMLELVCTYLRQAIDSGEHVLPVSTNFSYMNLREDTFPQSIIDMVDSFSLPHALIEMEFTESSFIDSKEAMHRAIRLLHDNGFSIAMDDFGSGISSLNMIQEFPFDILKIDQVFLRESGARGHTDDILATIMRLAKTLGIRTVAEGVETEDQCSLLCKLHCDAFQGYLLSKPLPESEFRALLASSL